METVIIGIAGGSASGKTTVAKKVYNQTKKYGTVVTLKIDDYYKLRTNMSFIEREKINYDHPDAYDISLLIKHLNDLKNNIAIDKPIYDFVDHNRSDVTEKIEPANVVIIEGILTLAIPEIRNICDIKLFVDTPDDIRFIRRLKRDIEKRGRSVDSVIDQYTLTVRPMHHTFVEPSKVYADLIIPEGGNNKIAIDFIITRIVDILINGNHHFE